MSLLLVPNGIMFARPARVGDEQSTKPSPILFQRFRKQLIRLKPSTVTAVALMILIQFVLPQTALTTSFAWSPSEPVPTAQSSQISYTITASAGANGAITPSGSVTVSSGATQTFTFTPAPNCRVSSVFVDGIYVGVSNSFTFTRVNRDRTIVVNFTALPKYADIISLWVVFWGVGSVIALIVAAIVMVIGKFEGVNWLWREIIFTMLTTLVGIIECYLIFSIFPAYKGEGNLFVDPAIVGIISGLILVPRLYIPAQTSTKKQNITLVSMAIAWLIMPLIIFMIPPLRNGM